MTQRLNLNIGCISKSILTFPMMIYSFDGKVTKSTAPEWETTSFWLPCRHGSWRPASHRLWTLPQVCKVVHFVRDFVTAFNPCPLILLQSQFVPSHRLICQTVVISVLPCLVHLGLANPLLWSTRVITHTTSMTPSKVVDSSRHSTLFEYLILSWCRWFN